MDELRGRFPTPRLDEYGVTTHGTDVLVFPRPYYYEPLLYLELPLTDAKYLQPHDVFTIGYDDNRPGVQSVYWHQSTGVFRILTLTLDKYDACARIRLPANAISAKVIHT